MVVKCEKCDKEFKTEEALNHHNKSKHFELYKEPKRLTDKQKKRIRNWSIFFLISFLIILGLYFSVSKNESGNNLLEYRLPAHTNIALHIHPFLEIEILGKKQIIPGNIGIEAAGMRVIHTHDSSGELHIESPKPYQFYLKDFFTIWNKNFSSECIFDYCVDDNHELLVFVNDIENNENIPLKDGDRIKIVYREK